jgi:hypothetical protein
MIYYYNGGLFPISTIVFADRIEDLCPHRNLAGQRSNFLVTPTKDYYGQTVFLNF